MRASVGLIILCAVVPTIATAQRYCVSGTITGGLACPNCPSKLGEKIAMTFDVVPGSVACFSTTEFCTAEAFVAVDIGSQHWSDGAKPSTNVQSGVWKSPQANYLSLIGSPFGSESASASSSILASLMAAFETPYPAGVKLPDNPPLPNPAYLLKAVGASLGSATAPYTGNDCARTGVLSSTPSIDSGGIVALNTVSNMIQAGSWISIYGQNLATSTAQWKGDLPTSLGGTSVTINSKQAYLWFVSPGQINLQVPDDTATGGVNVVVTTPNGIVTGTVLLAPFSPSFSLLDSRHAAATIIRTDGSGAYGNGAYDIVGPTGNSLGFKTVAAKPGDNVVLYGLGFGATNPSVPAGKPFSGAALTTNSVSLLINNVLVPTTFVGLVSPGLYQFNFRVPTNLGMTGELSLVGQIGTTRSPVGVVFTVQ